MLDISYGGLDNFFYWKSHETYLGNLQQDKMLCTTKKYSAGCTTKLW